MLHPSLVAAAVAADAKDPDDNGEMSAGDMIRQFADGGGEDDGSKAFAENVLAHLSEEDFDECPICLDVMERPMLLPGCFHKWCVTSFEEWTYRRLKRGKAARTASSCTSRTASKRGRRRDARNAARGPSR